MIKGWLVGEKALLSRFDTLNPAIQSGLEQGIGRLTLKLLAHVKADKLSDQVLRVRTGRLRRSINQRVDIEGTKVTGTVGTNVAYAARQEFGFQGTETVKEHLRMMTQAFGRPVKNPRKITVKTFSRTINYPAHSFLRSALEDMKGEIAAGIQQAINASASQVFGK